MFKGFKLLRFHIACNHNFLVPLLKKKYQNFRFTLLIVPPYWTAIATTQHIGHIYSLPHILLAEITEVQQFHCNSQHFFQMCTFSNVYIQMCQKSPLQVPFSKFYEYIKNIEKYEIHQKYIKNMSP